jgi:hypothetical protein
VDACQAALLAKPDEPRFMYQLEIVPVDVELAGAALLALSR